MIILVGFYNAEKYIKRCLQSIKSQSYKDFTVYITHDLSTDSSPEIVKEFIKDDPRFILVPDNDKKLYQAGNFDTTIRFNPNIQDSDVCIEVDGDDFLPDDRVFQRIHNLYKDENVWIANGSFMYSSGQFGFASRQTNFDNLRQQQFTASHIRTWRAGLWRKIDQKDLKDVFGNYWQWSGDLCFMYPMLEMSGPEHYRFMEDVNYIYNETNPINEHKLNMQMVTSHAYQIRNKEPYERLIQ